jgi:hypothetical protein
MCLRCVIMASKCVRVCAPRHMLYSSRRGMSTNNDHGCKIVACVVTGVASVH